jgi:hypothetical protein
VWRMMVRQWGCFNVVKNQNWSSSSSTTAAAYRERTVSHGMRTFVLCALHMSNFMLLFLYNVSTRLVDNREAKY